MIKPNMPPQNAAIKYNYIKKVRAQKHCELYELATQRADINHQIVHIKLRTRPCAL